MSAENLSVLTLKPFVTPPFVNFGENTKIGETSSAKLRVENVCENSAAIVRIKQFPWKKAVFTVDPLELKIEPNGFGVFEFSWKPEKGGKIRESVAFRINDSFVLHAFLIGAVDDKSHLIQEQRRPFGSLQINANKQPTRKTWATNFREVSSNFQEVPSIALNLEKTFVVEESVTIVEESVTTLVESTCTTVTEIVSSTSSRNVRQQRLVSTESEENDENAQVVAAERVQKTRLNKAKKKTTDAPSVFADFEEKTLVTWLNFILTPDFYDADVESAVKAKPDAKKLLHAIEAKSVSTQPTTSKEVVTLKMYSETRLLNGLRRRAAIFAKRFDVLAKSIENAVNSGKILVRADRAVHADIGIKQFLLNLLFSINPLWLRLGLETVYGEIVPLRANDDRIGMTQFLVHRLFNDPILMARFGVVGVRNTYKLGYQEAVSKFFLSKFLQLCLFLDKAKTERLIVHDPCLFSKDSPYKSVKDVLCALTKEILSGEGNLFKHLGYFGFKPSYVQTWLDEVRMPVENLSIELRDGVRLTRAVEILTNDFTLSAQMLGPPISILQKMHNVDVALKKLTTLEPSTFFTDISSKKVVAGHREVTLRLLWKLMIRFQDFFCVDVVKLRREISLLIRQMYVRRNSMEFAKEFLTTSDFSSDSNELLLLWCRGVCALYDMRIDSMEDLCKRCGVGMCFLISRYQPNLIAPNAIHFDETQQRSMGERTAFHNFRLFENAIKQLGQVPRLLPTSAFVSLDELTSPILYSFVGFLFNRLSALKIETEAALKIQMWFRRKSVVSLQRRRRHQFEFKRTELAAVRIQRWFRKRSVEKRRRIMVEHSAASAIQIWWRRILDKREKLRLVAGIRRDEQVARVLYEIEQGKRREIAAVKIQRWFGGILDKRTRLRVLAEEERKLGNAAAEIQRWYRANLERRRKLLVAAEKIQRWFRAVLDKRRKIFEENRRKEEVRLLELMKSVEEEAKRAAAKKIGNWYWGILEERKRKMLVLAAEREGRRRESAAVKIQRWFRAVLDKRRKIFEENRRKEEVRLLELMKSVEEEAKRAAAKKIGNWYWGILEERKRKMLVLAAEREGRRRESAAVKIQRQFRERLEKRRKNLELIRPEQERLTFEALKAEEGKRREIAAQTLQRWFRRISAVQWEILEQRRRKGEEMEGRKLELATIKIQRWIRGIFSTRKILEQRKREGEEMEGRRRELATIKIQRWIRGILAIRRQMFLQLERIRLENDQMLKKVEAEERRRQIAAMTIQMWFRRILVIRSTVLLLRRRRDEERIRMELEERSRKIAACEKIQRWFRRMSEKRRIFLESEVERCRECAASRIQAWYRRRVSEKRREEEEEERFVFEENRRRREIAVVTIQRWFRRISTVRRCNLLVLELRRRREEEMLLLELTKIETERRRRRELIAIKTIQRWFRRISEKRRKILLEQRKKKEENAAWIIQCWYRSILVERLRDKELRLIQAIGERTRREIAACRIQRWFLVKRRKIFEEKQSRNKEEQQLLILEAEESRRQEELCLVEEEEKLEIERKRREIETEAEKRGREMAASKIQTWYRKRIARQILVGRRIFGRVCVDVCRVVDDQADAAMIGRTTWKELKCEYTKCEDVAAKTEAQIERATIQVQRWYRRLVLRREYLRRLDVEKVEIRRNKAALVIQSFWRSWRVRRTHVDEMLPIIRGRLTAVNRDAKPEDTIYARTTLAFNYLSIYTGTNSLWHIREALKHLYIASKFSPVSCVRMVEEKVVDVLYLIIKEMNRGVASVHIVAAALSVVINIAKFEETRCSLLDDEDRWFVVLVELLEKNKEFNEDVFVKAAFLLIILNDDPERTGRTCFDERRPRLKTKIVKVGEFLKRRSEIEMRKNDEKFFKENGKVSAVLRKKAAQGAVDSQAAPNFTHSKFFPDWHLKKKRAQDVVHRLPALQWLCNVYNISL